MFPFRVAAGSALEAVFGREVTATYLRELELGRPLRVQVLDDGSGLPEGFDIDDTQSLGLSIVRDLVRSQLLTAYLRDGLPTVYAWVHYRRPGDEPRKS